MYTIVSRGLIFYHHKRNNFIFFFRQQLFEFDERHEKKDEDAFHFIAYIPFKGRLYELDGLQEVRDS
jgi:hypothetical protein